MVNRSLHAKQTRTFLCSRYSAQFSRDCAAVALTVAVLLFGMGRAAAEPLPVVDAGVSVADAGPLPGYALDFRKESRKIRAFLAQKLDLTVDPQNLFDVPLDAPDDKVRLECRRIRDLLESQDAAAPTAADAGPSTTPGPAIGSGLEAVDLNAWRARLELDRARYAFYTLPAARRAELVRLHRERQQKALALDHEMAISHAERDAHRAEEQQRKALEEARRASTEAARLVNEEDARLLSVTRRQAEYESSMIQRRAELDARSEAVLAWRRRVAEISSGRFDAAAQARADVAYIELRATLREARSLLSSALGRMGEGVENVPTAGKDPLESLPAEVDRSVAVQQRQRVTAKAIELEGAERELETAEASQLMNEVEALNRLRLELLGALSQQKRESVLGFGPSGWDQAASEVWQVVLTARYHLHAAFDWLAAIKSGDRRGSSAWLAFVLLLKWALPIGLFVWWRRHADAELERLRQSQRTKVRSRRDGDWLRFDYAERGVAFLQRVRRPLEWLLLVGLITWVMPEQIEELLEVRLASAVLVWVFGGLFIVLVIDALSSDPGHLSLRPPSSAPTNTGYLRLRSLSLVGRATVAFGLPLSLSDLLVGRGTIHSWVFSTCWFAAIPILFIIIGWWRPVIFERFARMRRPSRFTRWVLANRDPPPRLLASVQSSLAAVAGGVYLFLAGALRVVRNRVLTFELTRRLHAYLFRRDLSKKARTETITYAALPGEVFRVLGPEMSSAEPIQSAGDDQVRDVIRRIRSAGGGAVAIVGERGAGKTTLIDRVMESCGGLVAVTCSAGGLPELRLRLNGALGLPAATTLDEAAGAIDNRGEDHALLLDDAQHLIRPEMGGLADLDEVLSMFRRHSKSCTWILAFDESVWRFVERSRGAQPLFDHVIRLVPWTEEAIVRLITQRNETAGIKPDFSGLATDLPAKSDDFEIQEIVRRTEANYYRLLWDYAGGNPGVALHFWRRSLGVASNGQVFVHLFDAPDMSQLEALPDSAAFVLRAVIQLDWANAEHISRVTSLSLARVEDVLRYGSQRGYFDVNGDSYRVNWDWFRAVTRLLQRRHLSVSMT